MTIRSMLNKLFTSAPEAIPEAPVVMAADPRGAPGTRVYHEYLVGDESAEGKFPWLCRVYAQNGALNEKRGEAETYDAAKNAALSYAALTKRALRGDA